MNALSGLTETGPLVVSDVCKSFRWGESPIEVLRGVSMEVGGGESLAIVGPSGSGKSTLLHIIGGLDHADSGSVRLGDQDVTVMGERELAMFRNRHVGFVFQDHHLLPQLSVLDNVLVPVLAGRPVVPEDVERASGILDSVGLGDRLGHRPAELSGGQRERVAIARALVMGPRMILADEPTGNLDRRTAEQVTELLVSLPGEHGTILVVVTHAESLAGAMGRRVELVDGGLDF